MYTNVKVNVVRNEAAIMSHYRIISTEVPIGDEYELLFGDICVQMRVCRVYALSKRVLRELAACIRENMKYLLSNATYNTI